MGSFSDYVYWKRRGTKRYKRGSGEGEEVGKGGLICFYGCCRTVAYCFMLCCFMPCNVLLHAGMRDSMACIDAFVITCPISQSLFSINMVIRQLIWLWAAIMIKSNGVNYSHVIAPYSINPKPFPLSLSLSVCLSGCLADFLSVWLSDSYNILPDQSSHMFIHQSVYLIAICMSLDRLFIL